jgi:hypothetical protein
MATKKATTRTQAVKSDSVRDALYRIRRLPDDRLLELLDVIPASMLWPADESPKGR